MPAAKKSPAKRAPAKKSGLPRCRNGTRRDPVGKKCLSPFIRFYMKETARLKKETGFVAGTGTAANAAKWAKIKATAVANYHKQK